MILDVDINPQAYDLAQLDRQYNARASVPDCLQFLREYADASARARAQVDGRLGVPYGNHPDETLDIFPAARANAPVYLFIHGGYWRALSKDDSSFMAPAFTAAGATVVAVNYSLAPAVGIADIVAQCRKALAWVVRHIGDHGGDPQRIHVSGSSAGGHLAGMLLAGGWQRDYGLPDDVIQSASPISGLFDLRPLVHTHVNEWIRLDAASARDCSPRFFLPPRPCPMVVAWGQHETDEFKRQSRDYLGAWQQAGGRTEALEVPGRNHFDVLMELCDAQTPLARAILSLMGLAEAR